mmetsp:Transcript_78596/g.255149  ORF Transcript_78596/g.255149 Transcript_78596/m.255149 type:complete len:218 (-) Transcript_78596:1319-1972(-)
MAMFSGAARASGKFVRRAGAAPPAPVWAIAVRASSSGSALQLPFLPPFVEELGNVTIAPIETAKSMHPAFYIDEQYVQVERERIFGTHWFAAAHTADTGGCEGHRGGRHFDHHDVRQGLEDPGLLQRLPPQRCEGRLQRREGLQAAGLPIPLVGVPIGWHIEVHTTGRYSQGAQGLARLATCSRLGDVRGHSLLEPGAELGTARGEPRGLAEQAGAL